MNTCFFTLKTTVICNGNKKINYYSFVFRKEIFYGSSVWKHSRFKKGMTLVTLNKKYIYLLIILLNVKLKKKFFFFICTIYISVKMYHINFLFKRLIVF